MRLLRLAAIADLAVCGSTFGGGAISAPAAAAPAVRTIATPAPGVLAEKTHYYRRHYRRPYYRRYYRHPYYRRHYWRPYYHPYYHNYYNPYRQPYYW